MIPNITKGSSLRPLLRYLFGPGDREEHTDQRVVAGYRDCGDLQPSGGPGTGFDIAGLTADLSAARVASGGRGRKAWVWHCSLSLAADEGVRDDGMWREVAERFVSRMGFADPSDPTDAGCPWLAVRHGVSVNGNDHVHLVVILARQDGRSVRLDNDFRRAQNVCRDLEVEFGLAQVAVRDGRSSRRAPGRVELARRDAAGAAVTDREWLAQAVRAAVAGAADEAEWVAGMRAAGLMVAVRADKRDPEKVAGYAVARPVPDGGQPVWFSGRKLDGELSVVKVRERWPGGTVLTVGQWRDMSAGGISPGTTGAVVPAGQRLATWRAAAEGVRDVTAQVGRLGPGTSDVDLMARAAADVAVRIAWAVEPSGSGPVTRAARELSRAAVPVHRTGRDAPGDHGLRLARDLTRVARSVAAAGGTRTAPEVAAMLEVITALTRLATVIRDLRRAAGREASARAAHRAGTRLVPVITRGSQVLSRPVARRSEVVARRQAESRPGCAEAERG